MTHNHHLGPKTRVFHKKTFTGLLSNHFNFTASSFKIGLVKTLVNRAFKKINNAWLGFHNDVKNLIFVLQKNLFPLHLTEEVTN